MGPSPLKRPKSIPVALIKGLSPSQGIILLYWLGYRVPWSVIWAACDHWSLRYISFSYPCIAFFIWISFFVSSLFFWQKTIHLSNHLDTVLYFIYFQFVSTIMHIPISFTMKNLTFSKIEIGNGLTTLKMKRLHWGLVS